MTRLAITLFLLAAFLSGAAQAQPEAKKKKGYKVPVEIIGKDTLPVIVMEDATAEEKVETMSATELREWNRMVYRVDKVWPYVQEFTTQLAYLDSELNSLDKRSAKRKTIKAEQERLRAEFEAKLKDLSENEGKVVVNLIHRQTGRTAYELIRGYKNGITASFYQGVARINGLDLKDTFDPNSEDDQLLNRVLTYRGL